MIAGKDAPTFGEAKNSWLTGTAAWNYYAIVQWILGIRTSLEGLEISPVIPKSWPGFIATRRFRGVVYNISIERKGEGNTIALTVDGAPIKGTVVPVPIDGRKEVVVKGILT
jgi:cellobiose phosphorylase